ncbi:hypothetical protein JTB14_019204 [Gonioctena quinquepunctata]|nr:hypothetical protein JTB14_019204 [Gonioctena quinquepunctata]
MVRALGDKVAAILILGETGQNIHAAERIFRPVSRTYQRKLLREFGTTGSINDAKRSGRPQISDGKKIDILAEVIVNPTSSTTHVASTCEKVNVWAGILGNHIGGPLFSNTNLTGEVYLELLQNAIEPLILEILEDNPDEFGNLEITFQQDGAPPHYYGAVRRYLDEEYRGRWIGRRGSTEWPARSPELTPLDFSVGVP